MKYILYVLHRIKLFPSLICLRAAAVFRDGECYIILLFHVCQYFVVVFLIFFHFFYLFFKEMCGMVFTPRLYMMGESETEVGIAWIEDRFCR